MSRRQCGSSWPSPITLLYHPSFLVGLQGYILYQRRTVVYIVSSWSSCLCSSMWRGPQEYVPYEFVPTSSTVSRMSGSSNLDSFRDRWLVVVQLVLCWVLPPELVQHSCIAAIKLCQKKKNLKKKDNTHKKIKTTQIWTHKKRDSLTSWHKVT